MRASCHGLGVVFKSPRRVQVVFLRRSRDCQREKFEQCKEERDQFERLNRQQAKEIERLRREVEKRQAELDAEREKARRRAEAQEQGSPSVRFDDPPVGQHGYGAKMISLVLRLIKEAGVSLRAVARVLAVVFDVFGIDSKIPHWTTGRLWLQRLGHALMAEPAKKVSDMVWIIDHSVQIGKEKVLGVLGVRQADLPPRGEALRREHVRPLDTIPRTSWTKHEVHQELQKIAAKHGVPRAIVSDHGSDLLGGIQLFREEHQGDEQPVLELYDFKHKAACRMKALLEKHERFVAWQSQVGKTRCAIQQTELAFLTPPGPKPKARFMNLGPTLRWGERVLNLLERPSEKVQQWASRSRLEEKLGWVREFRDDIAKWSECQRVVDVGVAFTNKHGVFRGADRELRQALPVKLQHAESRKLATELVAFVRSETKKLKEGERLPLSTEVLESSFGQYKKLEDQHAKGGFTSLLLCFAALFVKVTPEVVREAFSRTSVRDVRQWVRDKLGITLASMRRSAYKEAEPPNGATKSPQPS